MSIQSAAAAVAAFVHERGAWRGPAHELRRQTRVNGRELRPAIEILRAQHGIRLELVNGEARLSSLDTPPPAPAQAPTRPSRVEVDESTYRTRFSAAYSRALRRLVPSLGIVAHLAAFHEALRAVGHMPGTPLAEQEAVRAELVRQVHAAERYQPATAGPPSGPQPAPTLPAPHRHSHEHHSCDRHRT